MIKPEDTKPIDINLIDISEHNVRKEEKDAGLEELANSIKKYGLLQPIVVVKKDGGERFELIIGQRRFLAYKHLGEAKIMATIYKEGILNNRLKLIFSLSENIQRRAIRPGDEIRVITQLYEELGSVKKVANDLKISRSKVSQSLRLESLLAKNAIKLLNESVINKTDIDRIIEKADGDEKKIEEMINKLVKVVKEGEYSSRQRTRIRDALIEEPKAAEKKLLEKAEKRRYLVRFILYLELDILKGLKKAAKKAETDQKSLTQNIIKDWLVERRFI